MDANQIEKLKALALAAEQSPAAWPFHHAAFSKAANPAAVLGLIAEVERLRAAAAAGTVEKDAERYRWLKERFTGYDFYWGGTPPYGEDADKGKCVIVFECGQGFCAGRDFEAGIDAAIEAHTEAGKDNA